VAGEITTTTNIDIQSSDPTLFNGAAQKSNVTKGTILNGPGLPVWPRYDKDGSIVHLDSTVTAGPDAARPRYEFLLKGMPTFKF